MTIPPIPIHLCPFCKSETNERSDCDTCCMPSLNYYSSFGVDRDSPEYEQERDPCFECFPDEWYECPACGVEIDE